MGYDVHGFKALTLVRPVTEDDDADSVCEDPRYDTDEFRFLHSTVHSRDLVDGLYEVTDPVKFYAMSYTTYDIWLKELVSMLGTTLKSPLPGPFVELYYRAEAYEIFRPELVQKLAQDFAAWQEKADAGSDDFKYIYGKLRQAFEHAGPTGYVRLA